MPRCDCDSMPSLHLYVNVGRCPGLTDTQIGGTFSWDFGVARVRLPQPSSESGHSLIRSTRLETGVHLGVRKPRTPGPSSDSSDGKEATNWLSPVFAAFLPPP